MSARLIRVGVFLTAAGLLAGCVSTAVNDSAKGGVAEGSRRSDENQKRRLGVLQLQAVRLAAENERLLIALDTAKKKLDEAVLEVVRSKAKLGSLGNRAEAAAALAEGDSLAKTVRSRSAAITQDSDFVAAERLLVLGNREYQNENYGGAYYLASSARTALAVLGARSRAEADQAGGESVDQRFVAPVDLVIDVRGNFRDAPGMESRVLRTLERGTVVRGLAARALWIHVELDDGLRGWVYHDRFRDQ